MGKSTLTNTLVGEGGHRILQAPDHPQPHLRHLNRGGQPVCLCGHPRAAQGPHPAG
ncbi:MAG: hypothetical protein ACLRWQ_21565 [Flavonifractor plautii]